MRMFNPRNFGQVVVQVAIIALLLVLAACRSKDEANPTSDCTSCPQPRSLYTYDFGGLETKSPSEVAKLLTALGYVGIVPSGRTASDRARLLEYYEVSKGLGNKFRVMAVMMPHRFHESSEGLHMEDHTAAIDLMADRGGQLWVWFRDEGSGYSQEVIRDFIAGIVRYANEKHVEIVLYPHSENIYPTAQDGLLLVDELAALGLELGLAVNLAHELYAGKGAEVAETFSRVKHRVASVTISGSDGQSPFIASLDESVFDVRPYMEAIRDSGFSGPIGFLNWKLTDPESYLERTFHEWEGLCQEVELFN